MPTYKRFILAAVTLFITINLEAQITTSSISGRMTDMNKKPIIGATIKEKGTANGTASDLDAKFSLEVSPGAVLEISYIGYQTQEVKVGDRTSLSVTLAENQQILDEVVVVGYGTTSRKNLTTSIATVKTEKISKIFVVRSGGDAAEPVYINI